MPHCGHQGYKLRSDRSLRTITAVAGGLVDTFGTSTFGREFVAFKKANVVKRRHLAAVALVTSTLFGVTAANAETFLLTFTQVGTPSNGCCGPFDVSATLQATASGSNYDITSITGTVTQNGAPFAITGLIAAPSDPGGYFWF